MKKKNKNYFNSIGFSSDCIDDFAIPYSFHNIQRPPQMCYPHVDYEDVITHGVEYMEKKDQTIFNYIVVFQPTNPIRSKFVLSECLHLIKNKNGDFLYTHHEDCNLKLKYIENTVFNNKNKDDCPIIKNANIYIYSRQYLFENKIMYNILSYKIPKYMGYDINVFDDILIVESFIKKYGYDL